MKIVFDMQKNKIALEGDGPELIRILEIAKEIVPEVSQIQITTANNSDSASESNAGDRKSMPAKGELPKTMRQFARSLSLSNSSERLAALAYYANKIEGKPSFSPREMDGWFTMCGFQKPNQMSVALYDGKRKYGYLENVSRGCWRISNQGENLIIRKIEEAVE